MGFAGQVFAARIAVGLAVPSASALSRTGGMLAKGAAGIYTALNSQRKAQAAKRVSDAQAEVDRLTKVGADAAKNQTNNIAGQAAIGMKRLENAGAANAAVLAKGGKSAFGEMKSTMGVEGIKMFKGVSAAATPIKKLMKITQNYAKMSKAQQKAAVTQAKEFETAKKKNVEAIKAENAANQTALNLLKDSSDKRTKAYKKEEKALNAKILQGDKNLEQGRKERASAIAEAEVIRTISVEALQAERKELEKAGLKGKELEEAIKKLGKAEKETAEDTKNLTASAADFGAKVVDVANDMSANFNAVLLETVATLSAFYYKLNQNTEALMEFEKELINANSVWQETDEVLFAAGEQVTQFGQTFGMNMQNGATGLYQLASAGLSATESMEVLGNTLKLSMAVQGDHNTIAKLTTQTLRGFDMEMSESAEVTDKFAHAIQKSLIEYEDLSSAVKFALPFFTSTGQSIDQLLGSLQVLTNRALEAGIAGRGLRQALAQFAKHADDNDAAFRKMGISVLDASGNMRQLNEIAADFAKVVGEDTVSNTELLTTLIDDLNVRGATAFVHLVQASDEFTQAVEDTAGAGGELDRMVEKQNESLTSQVQILKNNVQMIFQMSDATYIAEGYMNEFHKTVSLMIADLQGMIVTGADGEKQLTDFGLAIQDIAVSGMEALHELLREIIPLIKEFSQQGFINVEMLRLYTLPLRMVVRLLDIMGPQMTKALMTFYIMNKILPITTGLEILRNVVMLMYLKGLKDVIAAKGLETVTTVTNAAGVVTETVAKVTNTAATEAKTAAQSRGIFMTMWDTVTMTANTVASWFSWTATESWIIAKVTAIFTLATWTGALWTATLATLAYTVKLALGTWATITWTGANYAMAASFIYANAAMLLGVGAFILVGIAIAKMVYDSGALQGAWVYLTEPGGGLYRLMEAFKIFGLILQNTWDLIKYITGGIGNIVGLVKNFMSAIGDITGLSKLMGAIGSMSQTSSMYGGSYASGGYIQPMASGGGASGGNPYIVGERGPELFRPNGGGQVLNNTTTNHIMGQNADSGFSGTGGGMVVSSLIVESAEMNQSNLNIDSFAGNPAMRRRA